MRHEEEMKRLEEEIKDCKRCELGETRTNPVAGEGSLTAKVMLVGEAPGYHEDLKGRPFVGKAGKVLDELLESVGLERKDVYIANILKCRPPKNRNPAVAEIKACTPYLDAQIRIINPAVIATLGNFSLSYIFDKFALTPAKIGEIHGEVFSVNTISGIRMVIPLYHPAVVTYNPKKKGVLIDDFKTLVQYI